MRIALLVLFLLAAAPSAAKAWSGGCAGDLIEYGSGCAGAGGFVPHLSATGCPSPGQQVTLTVSEGLGGTLTCLFPGLAPNQIMMSNGCTLWLDIFGLHVNIQLLLGGDTPGVGTASVALPVPPNLPPGLSVYWQAIVMDASGIGNWRASNGLQITIN